MKRFFCLLLVLTLFPVVSFSDSDEGLYVGTWIHTEYLNDGTLQFIIIDLKDDHSAVTVFGNADGDNTKVPGRSFIGTWSQTKKGIHVVSGRNTSKDLFLTDDGRIAETNYGLTYVYYRVKQPELNDASSGPVSLSMLETGVQIPTGTYIIGEDIPAGTYRFDMNKSASSVKYYDKKTDLFPSSDFDLNTRSETYARLTMEEGGKLIIENSSVVLSYARKLFE